jgi:hypothetical protein
MRSIERSVLPVIVGGGVSSDKLISLLDRQTFTHSNDGDDGPSYINKRFGRVARSRQGSSGNVAMASMMTPGGRIGRRPQRHS